MMDQNGMTPLMWAAYRTHRYVTTIKYLVKIIFNIIICKINDEKKQLLLHLLILTILIISTKYITQITFWMLTFTLVIILSCPSITLNNF